MKIIILLWNILIYLKNIFRKIKAKYFNFYFTNYNQFINKRIVFNRNKSPYCAQKVIITGKGTIFIGNNCTFGSYRGGRFYGGYIEFNTRFKESTILIQNDISTNNNLFVCCANYIKIGDNSLIGEHVTIMDFEAHGLAPVNRNNIGTIGKVEIGKNVWIGNNVTILKNSEIGDNSIIATGAVVSGKFPNDVIIGGIPARIIKKL